MTKQESQMMKGVAILLMIFLHLFNQDINVAECHNLVFINNTPLVHILSRAASPVSFFLILGGYGLYTVYSKGDRHRWSRLGKLYIHYWIILLIFLTVGCLIRPETYPGSFSNILSNFTSYHTTYNGEMWFLLPYAMLSALSPYFFRLMAKFKAIYVIAITLFLHLCTSWLISSYGISFLFHNYWIYDPLLIIHLLFSFSLGAMAAREEFFKKLKNKCSQLQHKKYAWCVLILLVIINCIFKYNFFYAFGVICCLLIIGLPPFVKIILVKLGDQSMNMWMIHTWFCYYLFHDFIYSFSYPIIIFIVLVVISYLMSLIINKIAIPVERIFLNRKEIKEKPIL